MTKLSKTPLERARRATGWLAFVAATSLGVAASATAAEIRADVASGGALRLVVQTFSGDSELPAGAVQRAVTADELRRGVRVDVLELSGGAAANRVVAWVEAGDANLDLDGRSASPGRDSLRGEAAPDAEGRATIVLS